MPTNATRRVVVTGLGMISPLACGYEESWRRLLNAQSGATAIDAFNPEGLPSRIACQIPKKNGSGGGSVDDPHSFDPDNVCSARERRRIEDFILYAIAAADEAISDSGWKTHTPEQQNRTGVLIGSGIGGLPNIEQTSLNLNQLGPRRGVSPFFIPSVLINLASGQVSIRHQCKGPNHAVSTACASGTHAIGDAMRLIQNNHADVMLAGGSESAMCRLAIAGFSACKALSTGYNDRPKDASRPFDANRDGFVMGEGAAILILEELEHARERNAKILAEITGYALSGDAYHITSPDKSGDGAERTMRLALNDAKLSPNSIDYINAHGTSTPAGDEIELHAVERVLGKQAEKTLMSSTKSAIGHLLGAAGALEAVFSILSIRDQIAPPTLNLDNPDFDTPLNLVPHNAKKCKIHSVISNSFGFGGTNASLVFKAFNN